MDKSALLEPDCLDLNLLFTSCVIIDNLICLGFMTESLRWPQGKREVPKELTSTESTLAYIQLSFSLTTCEIGIISKR